MKIDGAPFPFRRSLLGGHLVLAVLLSTSAAQGQTKSTTPSSHGSTQSTNRVDELQAEILTLQQEVETLKSSLSLHELLLKNKQDRTDTITLDLTQKTYQRLDTDNGFFLVSVEEASPYLNGYKIHLSIGNPAYATYTNYKLKIRYGHSYDWSKFTRASYDEWSKAIQEKEISYPDSLQPGTWNGVDIMLAPVTADQLGFLTLSMTTSTVSMRTQ